MFKLGKAPHRNRNLFLENNIKEAKQVLWHTRKHLICWHSYTLNSTALCMYGYILKKNTSSDQCRVIVQADSSHDFFKKCISIPCGISAFASLSTGGSAEVSSDFCSLSPSPWPFSAGGVAAGFSSVSAGAGVGTFSCFD